MFRKLKTLFKAKKEQSYRKKRRLQNKKMTVSLKKNRSLVKDQLTENVLEKGVSNLILDFTGPIIKQNTCQFCEEPWRCYDLTKDRYSVNWCITCDRYHCTQCRNKHGFKSKTWPRISCGHCDQHIEGNNCKSILKLDTPSNKHKTHFCQRCVRYFHDCSLRTRVLSVRVVASTIRASDLNTLRVISLFFENFNRGNIRDIDFISAAEFECEPLKVRY